MTPTWVTPSRTLLGVTLVALAGLVAPASSCSPPPTASPGTRPAANGERPVSRPPDAGREARDSIPVGLAVGQRAPSFSVATLDGRPFGDADLRAQDKPYILYFFATW